MHKYIVFYEMIYHSRVSGQPDETKKSRRYTDVLRAEKIMASSDLDDIKSLLHNKLRHDEVMITGFNYVGEVEV